MVMHKKRGIEMYLLSFLFSATFLSATSLIFPSVFADSVVDVITINVSSSCTLSATGTSSHTADVGNSQSVSDIGTTNLNVICNDNSGYAIYAIGYTDNIYGKTVLSSSTLGSARDIITSSTVTTGTSSWAMKLASTTGTYAPTIVSDFASYHAVPEEYTKVAYYAASTDAGANATGSSFSTTYRAYVSPTQPAGTYVGQVKYTLVHPNGEFPMPDDLTGVTLRFNEEIDAESLYSLYDNFYAYDNIHFVVKMPVSEILMVNGVDDPSIVTWSQFVDAIPSLLASLGATDIQSDMEILNEEQDYAYVEYDGLAPWVYDSDGDGTNDEYRVDYYEGGSVKWRYLPASTGSISFTQGGESFNFDTVESILDSLPAQAWLSEAYCGDQWGWGSDYFRVISIYGGSDVANQDLIQWLSSNATVLYIEDSPAGKAWTFNDFTPSDPNLRWDVAGTVYNEQYTAYSFGSIDTNTDYGVPIWSFYYSSIEVPYTNGDGFVYLPEDLTIPEYSINYTAGWYFGNTQNPTQYVQTSPPTVVFGGGEDLYNAAFITWLRENASAN